MTATDRPYAIHHEPQCSNCKVELVDVRDDDDLTLRCPDCNALFNRHPDCVFYEFVRYMEVAP